MPALDSRAIKSADVNFFIFPPMEVTAGSMVRKVRATAAGNTRSDWSTVKGTGGLTLRFIQGWPAMHWMLTRAYLQTM